MLDLGKVFIVGASVDFLPGAVHISAEDEYKEAWKNALHKTLLAAQNPDISPDFLLMNDDFFLTEDFVGSEFPYYILKNSNGGLSGMHYFGIHCPIKINRELYRKMPLSPLMSGTYSPRSFYGNFYRFPTTPVADSVLRTGTGLRSFDEQLNGRPFFSISDQDMLDFHFVEWLHGRFPVPSSFEIDATRNA